MDDNEVLLIFTNVSNTDVTLVSFPFFLFWTLLYKEKQIECSVRVHFVNIKFVIS